jgi:hypothetical protein
MGLNMDFEHVSYFFIRIKTAVFLEWKYKKWFYEKPNLYYP